ncbi:hypothetical protein ACTFIZ_011785 [Dictyostelium cf. discoideum]
MEVELDLSQLKELFSNDKKKFFFKLLNSIIVVSFRNISIYSHSPFITNSKEITKDILNILKKHGCFAFLRGSIFYDLTTIVEKVVRSFILNYSFKFGVFKNENSKSFQLSNEILKLYLEYPKKMLFNCLVYSKANIKLTSIINLFLYYSTSSSSSLSLTKLYGSIYYGSFYSIALMLSSKYIDDYVCNKLDYYLNKYFNKYNYDNKPTRIIIRSLVKSIIVSPFYVIDSIYPSQVISSLVLNESIPTLVDPISIAISIFKNQGFKYFYKGLLPQFTLELLSSYFNSKKY